jgi:hypothetical protein
MHFVLGEWTPNPPPPRACVSEQLLKTGGIDANAFNIEHNKVLFTVQKGHEAGNVKEFLLEQPETDFVTLNSMKFFPRGRNYSVSEKRKARANDHAPSKKSKKGKKRKKPQKTEKDGGRTESL